MVEVGSDRIIVRVNTRWLQFTHSAMTADDKDAQPFEIHEDGRVTIGTVTEDMDFTAERLTREIMH